MALPPAGLKGCLLRLATPWRLRRAFQRAEPFDAPNVSAPARLRYDRGRAKRRAVMSKSHKPSGHNSVSPYLIVDGASGTIDFLKRVFGAEELLRVAADGDKVHHAEVRIDDSVVMLADGGPGYPPQPSHVHIYVPDVDATYRQALAAGASSVQAPVKKQDADKRGGIKDAGGTTWWIGTKVE
jgi:PhnB protein